MSWRPGTQVPQIGFEIATKNSVGVGIEARARRATDLRQRLRTLISDYGAEVLPTLDHMPVAHAKRTSFFYGDRPLMRPAAQPERCEQHLESYAMPRNRLGAHACPRAASHLVSETRTIAPGLQPHHPQA